jgi:CRP/FNR family transcriptional regulator, cyclic AMP receptor protein
MRYYTRKVKRFTRGEVIFSENSDCDGMYIIDKGRVRVYKTIETPKGESELELCQLGTKAMFGEMAMIDESKRSASVQAIEPTECTIITKQIFEDQLSRIPSWMVNMIRILVQRLRDTNEKLRGNLESHATNIPNDDPGSVLMVSSDTKGYLSSAIKSPAQLNGSTQMISREKLARILPETIVEDLFKDEN